MYITDRANFGPNLKSEVSHLSSSRDGQVGGALIARHGDAGVRGKMAIYTVVRGARKMADEVTNHRDDATPDIQTRNEGKGAGGDPQKPEHLSGLSSQKLDEVQE